jgi:hypothetical protein
MTEVGSVIDVGESIDVRTGVNVIMVSGESALRPGDRSFNIRADITATSLHRNVELFLIRHNVCLPFGVSYCCFARKPVDT